MTLVDLYLNFRVFFSQTRGVLENEYDKKTGGV
jgi:hypothetical protein